MRDFPPDVSASVIPDTRSPSRFLGWMLRVQFDVFVGMTLLIVAWQLPNVLSPWLLGRAIASGIIGRDPLATVGWAALLLAAIVFGAAGGIWQHTLVVRSWLIALYGTQKLVGHTSGQTWRRAHPCRGSWRVMLAPAKQPWPQRPATPPSPHGLRGKILARCKWPTWHQLKFWPVNTPKRYSRF